MIAENTPLILPITVNWTACVKRPRYKAQDWYDGRGIGPAMKTKWAAVSIRVADLADDATLKRALIVLCSTTIHCAKALASKKSTATRCLAQLRAIAPKVLPYAAPVWKVLD